MDSIDSQQFLTNVATNLVEDSAKNAWNNIKKFLKIWMPKIQSGIRQHMKNI